MRYVQLPGLCPLRYKTDTHNKGILVVRTVQGERNQCALPAVTILSKDMLLGTQCGLLGEFTGHGECPSCNTVAVRSSSV